MNRVYAVKSIPVRTTDGAIAGWVRVDCHATGPNPTNVIYLRDGTAAREAEALLRIHHDPDLLYPSREEAACDGVARLREADARGATVRSTRRRRRRR